jgi:hypothetical protein
MRSTRNQCDLIRNTDYHPQDGYNCFVQLPQSYQAHRQKRCQEPFFAGKKGVRNRFLEFVAFLGGEW